MGNTICAPSTSASMHVPSAEEGSEKFIVRSKITGYDLRVASVRMCRTASACNKNVVVSDQFRTVTPITRPPREKLSREILVKGHGPAMQDTRPPRNSFSGPASREAET